MKHASSNDFFCVCKGLPTDDVGGGKGHTVFQEIRPRAGFKTGDFAKELLGGEGYRRKTR